MDEEAVVTWRCLGQSGAEAMLQQQRKSTLKKNLVKCERDHNVKSWLHDGKQGCRVPKLLKVTGTEGDTSRFLAKLKDDFNIDALEPPPEGLDSAGLRSWAQGLSYGMLGRWGGLYKVDVPAPSDEKGWSAFHQTIARYLHEGPRSSPLGI